MAKYSKADIAEARARALELLGTPDKEGARKIFCVLRHSSRSGMSRRISFYAIVDGDLVWLDGLISKVCTYGDRSTAYPRAPHPQEGLKVGGCGMDMGFSVVYHFSQSLYGSTEDGQKRERAGYLLRAEWV